MSRMYPRPAIYDRLSIARLSGHDWDDIDRWLAEGSAEAHKNGHSQHDIDQYLGWGNPLGLGVDDGPS